MNRQNPQKITAVAGGGTHSVNVDSPVGLVRITSATSITLAAAVNITVSGTAEEGTYIRFIHDGGFTTDTSTGKSLIIFGTTIPDEQALYEAEITALYDGSAWDVRVFPSIEGDKNIDGVNIKNGTIPNAALTDDTITNAKLAGLARGYIKVGDASGDISDVNAKTDKYILIGDGTDLNSVAVSGDVTISNTGVTTIGAAKVTQSMLAYTPLEYSILETTIPSSSIKTMYTTPIDLIAAPGANKIIVPVSVMLMLDYGTATYTGGGVLAINWGATGITAFDGPAASFINSVSDVHYLGVPAGDTGEVANETLSITNGTAVFATGDGVLKVKIIYYIADFS